MPKPHPKITKAVLDLRRILDSTCSFEKMECEFHLHLAVLEYFKDKEKEEREMLEDECLKKERR